MSDPIGTQPGEDVPVEGTALDEGQAFGDGTRTAPSAAGRAAAMRPRGSQLQDLVDEPAKVMRIGTMMKQLLDEVRSAPLDDAARARLAGIHKRSIKEL